MPGSCTFLPWSQAWTNDFPSTLLVTWFLSYFLISGHNFWHNWKEERFLCIFVSTPWSPGFIKESSGRRVWWNEAIMESRKQRERREELGKEMHHSRSHPAVTTSFYKTPHPNTTVSCGFVNGLIYWWVLYGPSTFQKLHLWTLRLWKDILNLNHSRVLDTFGAAFVTFFSNISSVWSRGPYALCNKHLLCIQGRGHSLTSLLYLDTGLFPACESSWPHTCRSCSMSNTVTMLVTKSISYGNKN